MWDVGCRMWDKLMAEDNNGKYSEKNDPGSLVWQSGITDFYIKAMDDCLIPGLYFEWIVGGF